MTYGASREMDLDSFLGHSGTAGGKSGYLTKWKEDGSIDVFNHPRAGVASLWGHGWYRIADYKKKDEQVVEVRSQRVNCLESEAVLLRQRYRDNDDRRETPPVLCPYCITLEYVRDLVIDKQLDWLEPIFTFEAADSDPVVLHAGGWTKLIGSKKKAEYTKEEQGALRKAGIALDEVFLEEGYPRLQYLFSVIPVADPEQGCVLTFESQALGDAVKKVIRHEIMALKEKGDPRVNPYAFRWLYDENKTFSAKYDAVAMREIPITNAIRAAMEAPPPSIVEHVIPLNVRKLRASMEEHCEIELPWDELFGPAMEIADELEAEAKSAGSEDTSFDHGANARTHEVRGDVGQGEPGEVADDEDEDVECENCHQAMKASESTCPHCKASYLPDGTMVPPPPPQEASVPAKPPLRSRSHAAAAKSPPAPAQEAPQGAVAGEAAPGGVRYRTSARRRSVG